jgi:hypothetical protein
VQALDVGVGVEARAMGFVPLPERSGVAKGYSVSAFAQGLGIGEPSDTDIEDARRLCAGRPARCDLDVACLLFIAFVLIVFSLALCLAF